MEKISNYHTHTQLCKHATGTVEDYIMKAKEEGCLELGMSDHCPYSRKSNLYWPDIRMTEEEAISYISQVRECSKKVDFPVYAGFECEWDKSSYTWYKDELLGRMNADYLIFGPHWVYDFGEYIYILNVDSVQLFHKYVEQTIDGIKSGLYKFIAHPDLFMGAYKEWDADSKAMLGAILDAAIDCNLPVEINGNGLNRNMNQTKNGLRHPYPYDEFWDLVSTKNIDVVCSSDAHSPDCVISWAKDAREYAKKHNIIPVEKLLINGVEK